MNDKTPVFPASVYFPLAVGNWWDYKDNATGEISRSSITGNRSISGTVTKVYEYADGTKRYYTSDSNGVRVYGEYVTTDVFTGDVIFDAPFRYLPNNAEIRTSEISTTHYSFTMYVPGYGNVTAHVDLTSTTIVLNLEDIQTEHSMLRDCVKVSNQITQVVDVNGTKETVVGDTALYWLCEGIGVVKALSTDVDEVITQSHVDGETRNY